jgi:hypothetical protein
MSIKIEKTAKNVLAKLIGSPPGMVTTITRENTRNAANKSGGEEVTVSIPRSLPTEATNGNLTN